jgi:hypothetical protein
VRDAALERFKRDMENFEKAASRITATSAYDGGTEPAALAWLLTFLSLDIATLNEWQRDEAFWNVFRFCFDGGQGWSTDFARQGARELHWPVTATDRTNTVEQIQRDARTALADYIQTGVGTFPKGEGAFVVFVRGNPRLRYGGADIGSMFYYMAAQLLSRYADRVKQCEGCPLIMLVGRKDQRFHSQSCQILSFVRKKRAKEKAARLAREQRKEMKAKHRKKARANKGGTRHGTKR